MQNSTLILTEQQQPYGESYITTIIQAIAA